VRSVVEGHPWVHFVLVLVLGLLGSFTAGILCLGQWREKVYKMHFRTKWNKLGVIGDMFAEDTPPYQGFL